MCGIVGITGPREVGPLLIEGLKRLEYRGYDSAGIATLSNGGFTIHRSPGKLGNLVEKLSLEPAVGDDRDRAHALGHAWTADGAQRPSPNRLHRPDRRRPQRHLRRTLPSAKPRSRRPAIVSTARPTPRSSREVEAAFQGDLDAAVRAAVKKLTGAYAGAVSSSREPGVLVAARSGPPIALGLGDGENYVASDPVALVPWTRDVIFLEDGDVARVDKKGVAIHNAEGARLERQVHRIMWDAVAAEKGGYRHFMAKEIHEQPTAVAESLGGKVSLETGELYIYFTAPDPGEGPGGYDRVLLLACGTSWHSGLVGKFLIEGMARIPVEVDYSSEFRYRRPVVNGKTLTIGISQSGETADTVAALPVARCSGSPRLNLNVPGSPIARKATRPATDAGPEIGVASTKAFTSQCTVLAMLALVLRRGCGISSFSAGRGSSTTPATARQGRAAPSATTPSERSPRSTPSATTSSTWAGSSTSPRPSKAR